MAIRLIRQQSDIPNVSNKDDVSMVRYAYNGYNGVIKGLGNELKAEYNSTTNTFKLLSGRIVLQGWEVDIDASGVNVKLDNVVGIQRYSLYLQIDESVTPESVTFKATKNTLDYPQIDVGDDLTQNPGGVARLLLYTFTFSATAVGLNSVTGITAKFKKIPYLGDAFEDDRQTVKKATDSINAEYARNIKSNRISITTATPVGTIFDSFELENYRRYAIEFSHKINSEKSVHCLATGVAYGGVLLATAKYYDGTAEMDTFEIILKKLESTSNTQYTDGRVNGMGFTGYVFYISAIYILEKIEWE